MHEKEKTKLHRKLLSWYTQNGRHDLPWRRTNNIYHIYISEIMLQQTQVLRVAQEYYPKFLRHFKTLKELAEASEESIHALWSGLGYYSRATNLHKTAQITGGQLPTEYKELLKLPGIGRYTASALCSFGYNQPLPVVDTNIKRVIMRLFGLRNPAEKIVWEKATLLLNIAEPKAHNLALMDLGALICTPKHPNCSLCPLATFCQAKEQPHDYSITKQSKSIFLELFLGVYIKEKKVAFTVSKGPMYKGLLVLPECEAVQSRHIGSFRHSYTKYRLKVNLYHLQKPPHEALTYLFVEEALNAHISSLTKKALKLLLKEYPSMR